MKNERTYKTNDLIEIFQLSKERIRQLRSGCDSRTVRKDKSVHVGFIKPVLIEKKDWVWVKGRVKFYQSAVDKLISGGYGKYKHEK